MASNADGREKGERKGFPTQKTKATNNTTETVKEPVKTKNELGEAADATETLKATSKIADPALAAEDTTKPRAPETLVPSPEATADGENTAATTGDKDGERVAAAATKQPTEATTKPAAAPETDADIEPPKLTEEDVIATVDDQDERSAAPELPQAVQELKNKVDQVLENGKKTQTKITWSDETAAIVVPPVLDLSKLQDTLDNLVMDLKQREVASGFVYFLKTAVDILNDLGHDAIERVAEVFSKETTIQRGNQEKLAQSFAKAVDLLRPAAEFIPTFAEDLRTWKETILDEAKKQHAAELDKVKNQYTSDIAELKAELKADCQKQVEQCLEKQTERFNNCVSATTQTLQKGYVHFAQPEIEKATGDMVRKIMEGGKGGGNHYMIEKMQEITTAAQKARVEEITYLQEQMREFVRADRDRPDDPRYSETTMSGARATFEVTRIQVDSMIDHIVDLDNVTEKLKTDFANLEQRSLRPEAIMRIADRILDLESEGTQLQKRVEGLEQHPSGQGVLDTTDTTTAEPWTLDKEEFALMVHYLLKLSERVESMVEPVKKCCAHLNIPCELGDEQVGEGRQDAASGAS